MIRIALEIYFLVAILAVCVLGAFIYSPPVQPMEQMNHSGAVLRVTEPVGYNRAHEAWIRGEK